MRLRFFGEASALSTVALAAGALFFGACDGSGGSGVSPSRAGVIDLDGGHGAGPTYLPCDVDAILETNCRKCHSRPPQFGAPMPLMTWDDLHARAVSDASKKVYELVAMKIANDRAPMPPPPNERLSEADRKVIMDWVAAGAPRGPETCGGTTPGGGGTKLTSCTPDLTLLPSEPWTMPKTAGDEYACWGVDLTRPAPTHITAFAPKIDNTKIVHHVVVYEAPESYDTKPKPCSAGASLSWRMVFGWAPGASGLELPPEAGFPIATTGATHYVVQVHYSNPQALEGEKDMSGIEVCTSAPRPYEADVMAFGTQDIRIPPNPPGGVYTRECTLTIPQQFAGIHWFAVMPHMHKLGVSMKTELTPAAGGSKVDLGTMETFSFESQAWLPINAVSAAGDVVTTTCSWKNNTGAEVRFGENTADEMCYSFTLYYPRIQLPLWSWAAPAAISSCVTK
jgi:hypothetical protein